MSRLNAFGKLAIITGNGYGSLKYLKARPRHSGEDCDWVLCHCRTLIVTTDEVRSNRLLSQVQSIGMIIDALPHVMVSMDIDSFQNSARHLCIDHSLTLAESVLAQQATSMPSRKSLVATKHSYLPGEPMIERRSLQ